jgi:Ferric reductase NAD binding domain
MGDTEKSSSSVDFVARNYDNEVSMFGFGDKLSTVVQVIDCDGDDCVPPVSKPMQQEPAKAQDRNQLHSNRAGTVPKAIGGMVIKVEGPIGASSQGFKDYPILFLVGGGMGVTVSRVVSRLAAQSFLLAHTPLNSYSILSRYNYKPMISVLKELLVNPGKMERVFFYWTTRDHALFELFTKVMDDIYDHYFRCVIS